MFQFVNLENATDAMNGQIQDDDQESQENHEGRRKGKRDSVIPKKKKDMKIMIENLLERMEEKDGAMKDKDFFIEQFSNKLEREKLQQHQRLSEVEDKKENLSEEVRNLERVLSEKDQDLSLANEKLEKKRTSASRLQNDLRKLQSELRNTQAVRKKLEQQLSVNCRALQELQANLGKEQQARQRLEEELLQSRRTCARLERLLSQSNQQAAQTKDETIREQMRQLEQERERVRGLPTEVDGKRIIRVSIGKFDCLKPRHCEDIKGIVGPTCFGALQTLEKQAPHFCIYT